MTKISRPRPQPRPLARSNGATPKEVQQLQRNKRAQVTKNADGSVTRRRTTAKQDKSVTTSEGKLLESRLEYRKSSTSARGTQSESSYVEQRDMIGRRSTEARRQTTNARGDVTSNTRTRDTFGIEKEVRERNTTRQRGADTTETATRSTSRDTRGNRQTSSDVTRTTERDNTTTTRNERRTNGTDLTTNSNTRYEDGKFSVSGGADWSRRHSIDRSYNRETTVDAQRTIERLDRGASRVGRAFQALGLEHEWSSQVAPERMRENTLYQSDHASVTTQVGVTGSQRFAINHEGIQGEFDRTASAEITARSHGETSGRYGTASYDARATAGASANVNAQGRIDSNGLDARINARVRAGVDAEVTARAQTQSVRFLGTDLNAGVEGTARATAEVSAEATGGVRVTRNPPAAIIEGSAGASAVAKVEGSIRASAGPFSVVANGYASAGAEARASGVFGYENGRLRIGGSVGAAVGLGLGGGATVEVDVRQIQQMARNAADVNGDGRLGLDDAFAAARGAARLATNAGRAVRSAADVNGDGRLDLRDVGAAASRTAAAVTHTAERAAAAVTHTAERAVSAAATAVTQTAQRAATAVRNAADVNGDGRLDAADARAAAGRAVNAAANAVSNTAQAAANAVSNTAHAAANAVSNSARRVAGWFGF